MRSVHFLAALVAFALARGALAADVTLESGVTDTNRYGHRWSGAVPYRDAFEVDFQGDGRDLTLSLTRYDIDFDDEVSLTLNGRPIGYLDRTSNNATATSTIALPAASLLVGTNTLRFEQRTSGYIWGVTDLLLSGGGSGTGGTGGTSAGSTTGSGGTSTGGTSTGGTSTGGGSGAQLVRGVRDGARYGFRFEGVNNHRDFYETTFEGGSTDLLLSLTVFDIDLADEVRVLVNGQSVGFLARTANNARGADTIAIPAARQRSGLNTLRFEQKTSGYYWGVTDLLLSDGGSGTGGTTGGSTGGTSTGGTSTGGTSTGGTSTGGTSTGGTSTGGTSTGGTSTGGTSTGGTSTGGTSTGGGSGAQLVRGVRDGARYGFRFEGVNNHRDFYETTFEGGSTDLLLSLTVFDIDLADEVRVLVNGQSVGFLARTANNARGADTIAIPAARQRSGLNTLRFEQKTSGYYWGVTDLLLSDGGSGTGGTTGGSTGGTSTGGTSTGGTSTGGTSTGGTSTGGTSTGGTSTGGTSTGGGSGAQLVRGVRDGARYGFRFEGVNNHRDFYETTFEGGSTDLLLSLTVFDIDLADEVRVLVNGQSVGFLARTANNARGTDTIAIPAARQRSGLNTLRFEQKTSGYYWGVTDLLLIGSSGGGGSGGGGPAPNAAPVANAGPDVDVVLGANVTVDGSASTDSDSTTLTYTWKETSGAILSNEVAYTFVGATLGSRTITLTVTDDSGASDTDTVTVTVTEPANAPPVADAGADASVVLGDEVTVDGSNSTDSDGVTLTYAWTDAAGTALSSDAAYTFTPAVAGARTLTLTVTDEGGASDTDTVTVTVTEPANAPPVADAGTDASVELGDTLALDGSGSSDADGDIESFIWTDETGAMLEDLVSFDFTPTRTGVLTLTLTVTDAAGQSASDTVTVTVTSPPPVSKPFPHLADYELAFADDFDGNALDPNKWYTGLLWGPYLSINNEEQLYVDTLGMHSSEQGGARDPFEVSGGTLKITATPTTSDLQPPPRPPRDSSLWQRKFSTYQYGDAVGSPGEPGYRPGYQASGVNYLSGILTSYESFKTTHGYFEMRAKLPAGRGLWPAFWMLPTHYVESVPEIDIMEFLGQDVDRLYHTYHYFNVADNWRQISTPSYRSNAADWTSDFHTFGMAWSPREITWYVDGVAVKTVRDSEYLIANQAMYLIANLAVGGNWPGAPDASTLFPATFEIDYIRAYKKKLSSALNIGRDYQLMFGDEFNGSSLDPNKWKTHFIWGPYLPINREEQYYIDALDSDKGIGYSPFSVADGVLSITARAADDPEGVPPPAELPGINERIWSDHPTFRRNQDYVPGDFTSGIITSYESFKFVNGYAEIRAKLPKGKGLWPAFWLLNRYYVGQSPEIDILETRGERPREVTHAYHRWVTGGTLSSNVFETVGGDPSEGYSDGFHTFGVRWRPGSITWYIDREPVKTYTGADVSYQLMYVIANLAVGGGFPASPDDPSVFPVSYDIDYIRVYQEKDPR